LTGKGDLLRARLRPGNTHSAEGVIDLISPLVERYRSRFKQFWLRGDAAFAGPELYEFREARRITYFIPLPSNNRRIVKVGARVVYHARRWHVHVAKAFSLARYYRILFA
jgi:hypothetical protein